MSKKQSKRQSKHWLVPDMLVFLALSVLPIAAFWLANYPDVTFYVGLLTLSLVVLFGFHIYKPIHAKLQYFKYDINLNLFSLGVVIAGAMGMIIFSTMLAAAIHARTLLTVPMQRLALQYGQVSLPPFWSDTLYQVTLVASSEEACKLVVMIAVFLAFKPAIGNLGAGTLAIGSAIGGWALLHTFRNPDYQGSTAPLMVFGAFIDGLILLAILFLTKSWLATVLTHFGYNFYSVCDQYHVFSGSTTPASSAIGLIRSSAIRPLAASFDWMSEAGKIWSNYVSLYNQIVNFIIQIVQATTGITLLPWEVILGMLGVTVILLIAFGKIVAYILTGISILILLSGLH